MQVVVSFLSSRQRVVGKAALLSASEILQRRNYFYSHNNGHCRKGSFFFSTDSPSTDKDWQQHGLVQKTKDLISEKVVTPKIQFYVLAAGGTITAYLVSKGLLSFTSFFTHLSPVFIAKYSFYSGFGTASLLGVVGLLSAENLYIRADPVYKYCKSWIVNDIRVQQILGQDIESGDLRSYRLDPGNFHFDGKSLIWRPPRIQMIFDVTATGPPYRTGLVTAEATKKVGFPPRLKTNLLKIDYETGNEGEGGKVEGDKTMFLVGSSINLTRISTRSGLSLQKLAEHVHINRGSAEINVQK